MFNYSKRNLIIISVILSLVVLLSINLIRIKFFLDQKNNENSILKTSQLKSNKNEEKNKNHFEIKNIEEIVLNQYSENDWRILIPKIDLDAPILEGTSQEVLRRGVGHFENTDTWNGNICLAAHNRGYKYNYFQEIKNLEIGDIIEYKKNDELRKYSVVWIGKIKETDFSYLEDTNENMITLITCAENMPEYRVCVQAYEIKTL